MKIRVSQCGIIGYVAECNDCNWFMADHIDCTRVRHEIYKHIRSTGHSVAVEKVVATIYSPEKESEK